MKNNVAYVVLCFTAFALLSCKSGKEEQKNESAVQAANDILAPQSAEDEFASMEQNLLNDSLNIELRTALAARYYQKGDLEKATKHYLVISRVDKENLNALSSLGNIYYDSQQDDKAIQFYEKALSLDPQNINMRCDLATCYFRINRLKKATEILKENIAMDYNHKQSHYNLSVILKQSGNIKEADAEMAIYNSLSSPSK